MWEDIKFVIRVFLFTLFALFLLALFKGLVEETRRAFSLTPEQVECLSQTQDNNPTGDTVGRALAFAIFICGVCMLISIVYAIASMPAQ